MTTSIEETRETLDDFAKLLFKMPDKLRDNAYFTLNGMFLNYEVRKTYPTSKEGERGNIRQAIQILKLSHTK